MKHKIEKIIEAENGQVFTVSRGNIPPVDLPQEAIDYLVAQGMDRDQAENLKTTGVSIRIMRAKHMENRLAEPPRTYRTATEMVLFRVERSHELKNDPLEELLDNFGDP